MSSEPPDLAAFVASLLSAWRMGEIRPTFCCASPTMREDAGCGDATVDRFLATISAVL